MRAPTSWGVLWEAQRHHSGQPQQITGGLCRRHPVRGAVHAALRSHLHQFGGIEVNFPLMVVYGLVGSAITDWGICLSLSSSVSMDQGLWKCDPRPWRDAGPLRQHDLCGSGSLADGDSVSSLLGGYGGQRGVLSYEQMYFNIGLHRFHRAQSLDVIAACGMRAAALTANGASGSWRSRHAGSSRSWPS